MGDTSSGPGGVVYNTPSGPSGLLMSLDPRYHLAQSQAGLAKQQLSQEQAFQGGLPTDQSGNTDWNAAAQRMYQLGAFDQGNSLLSTGVRMSALNELMGRGQSGAGSSGGVPGSGGGALPAVDGGMIAPSVGGDDNGVMPPSGAAPGSAPAPPPGGQGAAPASSDSGQVAPMDVFAHSIGAMESSNNYAAQGPIQKNGDRAYGRFQVTGANIPSWTKDVLGHSMTPDQFLADPQAQNAVFASKFGGFIKQYGSPADAASVWFSGRPLQQAGNASDSLGTTAPAYVQKFLAGIGPAAQALRGGQGQPSAAPPASAAGAPSMPSGGQAAPISFGGPAPASSPAGEAGRLRLPHRPTAAPRPISRPIPS